MTTSENSPQSDLPGMESALTSSAAVSRARIFPSPAKARESTAQGRDSGRNTPVLLAKYDRATSSWKTSQLCLDGDYQEFSETWPRSGMTRNGTLFLLPTLELRTVGKESGSWPTPDAMVANLTEDLDNWQTRRERVKATKKNGNGFGMPLAVAARMWPTPDTQNHRDGSKLRKDNNLAEGGRHGVSLHHAVLWPTPSASDNRDRGNLSTPAIQRRLSKGKQIMLSMSVSEESGQLNPTWVEWLMGFPLGWTDLEDWVTPLSLKSPNSSGGQ